MKLTKQLLIKKYKINKKPLKQIAEETGHSPSTIWRNLKRLNIKIRNKSEAHADISGNKNPSKRPEVREKISESKRGLKRPDVSEKNRKRTGKKNPRYNVERHKKHYCIECENEICYNTWYLGNKLCNSCKLKGERSSTYIDGRSYEPYPQEFNSKLKYEIRERDDFTCQECGMIEEEHIIIYGRVLDVHHIDYNKENCKKDNLISLCKQCNIRANFNRKYWEEYFQAKIKEKI